MASRGTHAQLSSCKPLTQRLSTPSRFLCLRRISEFQKDLDKRLAQGGFLFKHALDSALETISHESDVMRQLVPRSHPWVSEAADYQIAFPAFAEWFGTP